MAPKTPAKDSVDMAKSDAMILLNVLTSVSDLKLDNKVLAPILGLSSTKNVARSLNVRIKPYGFEFKSGKILSIGQDADGGTPSPNGEEGEASGEAASPTNAKAPKAPKAPKTPKTPKAAPRSKKRKLDDAAMESDDAVVKGEDVEEDAVKDEDNNSGIDN